MNCSFRGCNCGKVFCSYFLNALGIWFLGFDSLKIHIINFPEGREGVCHLIGIHHPLMVLRNIHGTVRDEI